MFQCKRSQPAEQFRAVVLETDVAWKAPSVSPRTRTWHVYHKCDSTANFPTDIRYCKCSMLGSVARYLSTPTTSVPGFDA